MDEPHAAADPQDATAARTNEEEARAAEAELRAKLKKTFDTLDADGSGEISVDEIIDLLGSLDANTKSLNVVEVVRAADTDQSGEIDFDEFFEAMKAPVAFGDNGLTFADLVITAAHPADVARSLDEANTRFVAAFNEFVCDTPTTNEGGETETNAVLFSFTPTE